MHAMVDPGGPRTVREARAGPDVAQAERDGVLGRRCRTALEVARHLARHRPCLDRDPRRAAVGSAHRHLDAEPQHLPAHRARERAVQHVVVHEPVADGARGVDDERLRLAQGEEPERVVELAAGQQDGDEGGITGGAGVEGRERGQLGADLGGGVQEEPGRAVGRDGDALLGTRRGAQRAGADALTVLAAAVPLGKAAARGRA